MQVAAGGGRNGHLRGQPSPEQRVTLGDRVEFVKAPRAASGGMAAASAIHTEP